MEVAHEKRVPWKSWEDFTGWAQDFSLRQKVVGGFLGVVVLVGIVTALIGTRLVRDTIITRSHKQLTSDLSTAVFILDQFRKNLELKVRMTAGSEKLKELLEQDNLDEIRNRLAIACAENDLDFLSIADGKGKVIVRAFVGAKTGGTMMFDPIAMAAAKGQGGSGIRIFSPEELVEENPTLRQRLHGKPGMIAEAAYPINLRLDERFVICGGALINDNQLIVDQISELVFKGEVHGGRPIGYVAIRQGAKVIATSFRDQSGHPATKLEPNSVVNREVLDKGRSQIASIDRMGRGYVVAYDPLRDVYGNVIGVIELATLEKPIMSVVDSLVITFALVALLGVLLMAGISYFLVQWINRPLELMLNAARKAAAGDLSHEVPVIARDEVGELAATFNLMIHNLAESRRKLEEWSQELASKVAQQSGELIKAQEQVARVKKLASLEKMADGMSHIMRHISDPLGVQSRTNEDGTTAQSRIMVVDQDEKALDVCRLALEDEGFEVKVTTSFQEALHELEQEFYDVVVADVDLPEVSGADLLKEVKYRQPEVTVILTASFKSTEEAVEVVKMGAYDYIPKPFGPHQITLMVYAALQTQQMLGRTRQQLAESRAETIFQRLPVAIALADKNHRVVYNNRAFVELASRDGQDVVVKGKTFRELFGLDPLDRDTGEEESPGSRWMQLEKVGRTAKLYNFKIEEEDLRVLMLVDITDTVMRDKMADVFKAETITKAQQVIHQQMRVAQEIAQLLGETTAETKAALFELMKLAKEVGETR